jgi:hypothetical protein
MNLMKVDLSGSMKNEGKERMSARDLSRAEGKGNNSSTHCSI